MTDYASSPGGSWLKVFISAKVRLVDQLNLIANSPKKKRLVLVIIFEKILWFFWNIYLPETLYFIILMNGLVCLNAQPEQAPIQKILFLTKRPVRFIGYLQYWEMNYINWTAFYIW